MTKGDEASSRRVIGHELLTSIGGVMMMTGTTLAGLAGLCTGSFLNLCIDRIPARRSVVFPASQCDCCGHRLGVLDLVPVLNYLYRQGRCHWCGVRLPWRYPVVELAVGAIFAQAWAYTGSAWVTLATWVLVSILITTAAIDVYHRIIPDRLILAGLVAGMPLAVLQSGETLLLGLISFLLAGGFMLAIAVLSRGGMGGGDVKLAALMGLYLGPAGMALALFLAFFTGGLVGTALLLTRAKDRKDTVPFGPFLAWGGIIAALWGPRIISWYIDLWK